MGFSTIASAAILGVAVLMAAEIITSDLLPKIESVNESYDDMKGRLRDQLQTDISILDVTRSLNGVNYDFTISVQNTGSVTLNTEDFIVLINGTGYLFTCSHTYLHPQVIGFFEVVDVAGDGEKRMKIITNNGVADYYTYVL